MHGCDGETGFSGRAFHQSGRDGENLSSWSSLKQSSGGNRRSSSNAIKNAIRVAKEFSENQVNAMLETELSRIEHDTKGIASVVL